MASSIIVFDLDGTLVDTAPDLIDSLNHCLALAGLEPVRGARLKQDVSFGSRVMLERAFARQRRPLPVAELDRLQAVFLDHYAASMPGRSQPFPGAVAALERFAAAGFTVAVCTNKLEGMSRRLLGALGLAERFAAICGADTFAFRKPDPRHLTATVAQAGADAGRAVMVGDSRTDIDTARAAGIPVVAVDFGYTDLPVRHFEPSRVISHYDELTVAMAERLIAEGGPQQPA
ncbi:phosphoglycolate phosphatase [Aquibium sp. A9E412]|uniref:phosphoglycolate phosphatase n=1 Tax=Aquibium sp. A9E412 TaxID=2976767 RepID=UPI0025B05172|nr:phosphoglycolate phosphatase [Aquibium sp. A9E412]MDN2567681.1 phosphoglycolate phosphatase [Aquibium sp. A9E412]